MWYSGEKTVIVNSEAHIIISYIGIEYGYKQNGENLFQDSDMAQWYKEACHQT